jgi:hypothetical protein
MKSIDLTVLSCRLKKALLGRRSTRKLSLLARSILIYLDEPPS